MQQQETKNMASTNFNHERLKLVDAITQFQNQITNLKEDLLHYSNKPNASEKYIFFKQQQIKVFESILIAVNDNTESTNQIFDTNQKEIAKLKNENFKLTGICLLHGISDISFYLRSKTNQIIAQVKQAYMEGWRQTPTELKQQFTKHDIVEISNLFKQARQLNINGK